MNMNENPTKEQLKELLGKCNDNDGPHILWVNLAGEVQFAALYGGSPKAWARKEKKNILFHDVSIDRGRGFVGPEAAAEESLVAAIFDDLLVYWRKAQGQ